MERNYTDTSSLSKSSVATHVWIQQRRGALNDIEAQRFAELLDEYGEDRMLAALGSQQRRGINGNLSYLEKVLSSQARASTERSRSSESRLIAANQNHARIPTGVLSFFEGLSDEGLESFIAETAGFLRMYARWELEYRRANGTRYTWVEDDDPRYPFGYMNIVVAA